MLKSENVNEVSNMNKWHIPVSYYNKNYLEKMLSEYDYFAIVRNPYTRMISVFKYWIKFCMENRDKSYMNVDEILAIYGNNLSLTPENLNAFVKRALKYDNILDGHLIPMYKHTHVPHYKSDVLICRILYFETLNEDFNTYINDMKLSIPINILKTEKKNASIEFELSVSHLDKNSINLINKYYEKDFQYYEYQKQ
jgi:hypothetical protein